MHILRFAKIKFCNFSEYYFGNFATFPTDECGIVKTLEQLQIVDVCSSIWCVLDQVLPLGDKIYHVDMLYPITFLEKRIKREKITRIMVSRCGKCPILSFFGISVCYCHRHLNVKIFISFSRYKVTL